MGDERNKWRKYEREAKMARDWAEQRARDKARGDQTPRCACGFTAEDKTIWVHDKKFWCVECLPLELLHLIGPVP
jgi:hypothetical protein